MILGNNSSVDALLQNEKKGSFVCQISVSPNHMFCSLVTLSK